MNDLVNEWIPASEPPKTAESVLVTLASTYSEYRKYSIARFIDLADGGKYWCDDRYGYLECEKYSDGHGGNSEYKVIAWQPLPVLYGQWHSEKIKPKEHEWVTVKDKDGNVYPDHQWVGHAWYRFCWRDGWRTDVDVVAWRYQ